MDTNPHTLETLFEQLGLDSSETAMRQFVAAHRPLDSSIALDRAPMWSDSQAAFIREALEDDSDWAEAVDELSAMLR